MLEENLRINEPGLNVLPPGVERYVISGGGLTGVQIFPDDEIEIINNEGNQICEIVVFNSDGNSDPSILNLKSSIIFSISFSGFPLILIFFLFCIK